MFLAGQKYIAGAKATKGGKEVGDGRRTPNEGIDQRNLKIWADLADKICVDRT